MLYQRIQAEYQHLQEKIHQLQQKIAELPEGKLICTHGKDGFRWYNSDGHHRTYISKKKRRYAEQLALKKYWMLAVEELEQEKRALGFYLRHHSSSPQKTEQLLMDPAYQELLKSHIRPTAVEDRQWMDVPYERNLNYPEHRIHKTVSGEWVRSKSESLLVFFLHTHHIPYRYECALHLGETTIYPDFTIRHPNTGKIYYWEHFGRMDDPNYAKAAGAKLQLYISHGIIPSIQLITTYETKDSPLDIATVEKIIQHYFV